MIMRPVSATRICLIAVLIALQFAVPVPATEARVVVTQPPAANPNIASAPAAVRLHVIPSRAEQLAYFKFDEGGGSVIRSYPNTALTATVMAGAGFTTTRPSGLDLAFRSFAAGNITTGRFEIPDNPALNTLSTTFSVAAWVRRNSSDLGTNSIIFDSGNGTNNWKVGFVTNTLALIDGANAFRSLGVLITDTLWHHMVFMKSGDGTNNLDIVLDGVPIHAASVGTVLAPAGAKAIGARTSGADPLDGQIDELRLYNSALKLSQIALLMQTGCINDGLTWSRAMEDLHCAINAGADGDEIWLQRGNYLPGVVPTATYHVTPALTIAGSFAGAETAFGQRPIITLTDVADPAALSVLNGDLLGNDIAGNLVPTATERGDNTNQLMFAVLTQTLDGLAFANGNRAGFGGSCAGGTGLCAMRAVTLSNSIFVHNSAGTQPAFVVNGSLVMDRSRVVHNRAQGDSIARVVSSLGATVRNSTFAHNYGGSAVRADTGRYEHCLFENNNAPGTTGGAIDGGGDVISSQFISNSAVLRGGAIDAGNRTINISDSLFERNRAAGSDGSAGNPGNSDGRGGAVFAEVARITSTLFVSNTASGGRGGSTSGGTLVVGANGEGGAVFVARNAGITDSVFRGNRAIGGPGGLVGNPAPNGDGNGGAIFSGGFTPFERNVLENNVADKHGGGVMLQPSTNQVSGMVNSVFASNVALHGAQMVVDGGNPRLEATHITFASATPITSNAIAVISGRVALTNTIIAGHSQAFSVTGGSARTHGLLRDAATAPGDGTHVNTVVGNPAFVNPAAGDFHLTAASAAIDRGGDAGVASDFDGDARPAGAGFDFGFDEAPAIPRRVMLPVVVR